MPPRDECQREHEFVLILAGVAELTDEVINSLFEAGCDDATPAIRAGRVYLTFTRVAVSLRDAILSAIRDVIRAEIDAEVTGVDNRNLVTQADIARRIDRPRQMVAQYIKGTRGPGNFPAPCWGMGEGHSFWAWCEVSAWLFESGIVDARVLREATDVAVINGVLEAIRQRRVDPMLSQAVIEAATKA